ncbi:MAG: hypothetical protein FJX47_14970, partial [Alphaproteobacteria bacterium]|nr:hypothetical protein [Alphaproteobacteria bacterium]
MDFVKLKLSGFKSFVEPTEFRIESGVTGLVGPNGCGKSNLVEALRWVMGETSAKQMRGGAMDDVIFNGNDQRPARNFAEVSLFLDNRLRAAPALFNDAEEIQVSRRIEREEGSQYRVNGRDVRARDVQLFFADAATGPRSPAMVSQGKVGAIINAKPIERRAILEEAAGVAGLHSRRHEAELRLNAAEQNLARVADMVGALETQLAGLERQARQAQRYRKLAADIRAAEATRFVLLIAEAEAAIATARERLIAAEADVASRETDAVASATAQAEAAAILPALRQTEAETGAALHRLLVARDGLAAEADRVAKEGREATERRDEILRDTGRAEALAGDSAAALDRLDGEGRGLRAAQAEEGEGISAAEAKVATETARLAEADAGVQAATEAVALEAARRQSLTRDIAVAGEKLSRLAARAAELAEERSSLEADTSRQAEVAAAAERVGAAEATVVQARDALDRLGERSDIAAAAQALAQAEHSVETARQSAGAALLDQGLAEATAETVRAETSLHEARLALAENHDHRRAAEADEAARREVWQASESVAQRLRVEQKTLTGLLAPDQTGLWSPILDAIRVTAGYEAAFGAAFAEDVDAPEDDSAPAHWRDLAAYDDAPSLPAGARPLADFVEAPNALVRRLGQIGLIEEQEGAALQAVLRPGQVLVARNGALWRWDGYVAKAGAPTLAAQRLAHRNRLADLAGELAAAEAEALERKNDHATARTRLADILRDEVARRDLALKAEIALDEARETRAGLASAL